MFPLENFDGLFTLMSMIFLECEKVLDTNTRIIPKQANHVARQRNVFKYCI